jgi:hypothetical protein
MQGFVAPKYVIARRSELTVKLKVPKILLLLLLLQ